jgi:hypothetical protein
LEATLIEKLKFIVSEVWAFLLPFIKILLTSGGKILMNAALEAVQACASMKDASGAQKRDAAFAIITAKLTGAGVEMATSVINAAIEAAVQKINES